MKILSSFFLISNNLPIDFETGIYLKNGFHQIYFTRTLLTDFRIAIYQKTELSLGYFLRGFVDRF